MTDTTTTDLLNYAREHAAKSWQMFAREKGLTDTRPCWEETVTPDGSMLLSGRLVGQRPTWALSRFARDFYLTLKPGDMRPQFDVTQSGRTVLVWRYDGVWVELWHPDSAAGPQTPAGPVQGPQVKAPEPVHSMPVPRRSLIGRASERLPFTRNRKKATA